jgi:hypothetical protein
MDEELRDLRRELARVERGRGHWYPDAVRDRVAAWVRRRRLAGATWRMLAIETSLPTETLRRWVSRSTPTRDSVTSLVPIEIVGDVEVSTAEDRGVRLITRAGNRIEGITIADAIAIVRVLG